MIEQTKLTYSLSGKAYEIQTKTIQDRWRKQVESLKVWKHHAHLSIKNVILED